MNPTAASRTATPVIMLMSTDHFLGTVIRVLTILMSNRQSTDVLNVGLCVYDELMDISIPRYGYRNGIKVKIVS